MNDLLKTCAVTKSFKIFYNEMTQSSIRSILQINYNPRIVAIRKSYFNEPVLKELLN